MNILSNKSYFLKEPQICYEFGTGKECGTLKSKTGLFLIGENEEWYCFQTQLPPEVFIEIKKSEIEQRLDEYFC